jgi:CRISPR-associated protein Cst2
MANISALNCINIAYLFKASIGSINGSFTEGNVSTVKKITLPDGHTLPYISGQSLRHHIRKRMEENGIKLSPLSATDVEKGVDVTAGDPEQFVDDDLFGFMIATPKENRRRTSAVRVSASIGMFPFRGDRDLGTKSKEETAGESGAGGNMFETEIYYNYFRTSILIELDRVGSFKPFELKKTDKKKVEPKTLGKAERIERLRTFFQAMTTLWGGGKQSRILTDLAPKFIITTVQTAKSPIFLEGFRLSQDESLDVDPILEILNDNQKIIKHVFVGLRSGIFKNESEIKTKLSGFRVDGEGIEVLPVNESIERVLESLKTVKI